MTKWCGRAFMTVSLVLALQAHSQTQQYFPTAQPGPAGFAFSQVLAIDDAGTGIGFVNQFGYCCDSSYLNDTAYVFRGATAAALNGPNGPNGGGGHAVAINKSGQQVVGYDFDAPGFPFNEAVIWDHGVPKDIGVLYKDVQNFIGTSSAAAINDLGVVVGSTTTAPPGGNSNNGVAPQHAFSWKAGGKMTDLGALAIGSSSESSQANAISPSGIIVGQSVTATGFAHAVEFLSGKVVDLGALDGAKGTSEALSVNDTVNGPTIVGSSDGDPVAWKGGKITALATLGGIGGSATSINASGQIVGHSLNKAGEDRATVWLNGEAIDLNSLIIPAGTKLPAGAILDTAYQITDNGLIEASYSTTSSVDGSVSVHSYLLTAAIPTHIAVSSTANPVRFGQSVKIIVHVTAASGASPGSFVTVMDGATVLARPAIGNNGFASYTTSALSVGSHAITASYDGKAPDGPSTSPVFTQNVDVTSTRTTLSSPANPATHGKRFTLTATVIPTFGSIAGNVTFKEGTTVLGTVKVDPRTREAALSTTINTAGRYALTAEYSAAAGFNNSQSSAVTEVVN